MNLPRLKKRRDVHSGDQAFFWSLRVVSLSIIVLFMAIVIQLGHLALPALGKFGFGFLFNSDWNPVSDKFGAASFLYGTVVSSILALIIAAPVSIGVALFLTELAPKKLVMILGFLVEMLAAIPSVVYGLWGIFVLAPLLRAYIQPFLGKHLGFLPLFQGAPYGIGMLTAGIILAIMITPTISAICREVFSAVSQTQREAALALGATRWEMIRLSVLRGVRSGVLGALVLGLGRALGETMAVTMVIGNRLGRALGETMAVTMVIGNRPEISASLFAPAQTMASVIANEYAEATSDLHLSALAAIGLSLFAVSFIINSSARFMIWKIK